MSQAAQPSRPGNGWIIFLDLGQTLVHYYERNKEEPEQFEKLMQLVLKEETDNISFFDRKYILLSPNTQATPPNPNELVVVFRPGVRELLSNTQRTDPNPDDMVVVLRPGVRELLHQLDREQGYKLAIWSAGMPKYIQPLVKILFTHEQLQQHPKRVKGPSFVLSQYHVISIAQPGGTVFCKPLQLLRVGGVDTSKVILFDDQDVNRVIQPTQVVKVPPFSPTITQTLDQTSEEPGRCLNQDNYLSTKAISAINTIRSGMESDETNRFSELERKHNTLKRECMRAELDLEKAKKRARKLRKLVQDECKQTCEAQEAARMLELLGSSVRSE